MITGILILWILIQLQAPAWTYVLLGVAFLGHIVQLAAEAENVTEKKNKDWLK